MLDKRYYIYLSKDEIKALKREEIEKRCRFLGEYLLDYPSMSIRQLAREHCMSKSQVHRDLHELRFIDDDLYCQVMRILRRRQR